MTLTITWSLLEAPVSFFGTGIVLAILAFVMLGEYRKVFMQDPRATMSVEVLMAIIAKSGGPGYLAAIVLAGALMFLVLALYNLAGVLPHVFLLT